jgi:D-sedoheptulose 7-phosphate isomerase
MIEYIENYLKETVEICQTIDRNSIAQLARLISGVRNQEGRVFIAGVGGSAANASHAVNDFRKIIKVEAHSLTENVSELTARINDDSWESSLADTLKVFRLGDKDMLMILSVGGGSDRTSKNLVEAIRFAKQNGCKVGSIVSRDGGYSKLLSDVCVLIPVINSQRITPHAEEIQAVVWHLLASALGDT